MTSFAGHPQAMLTEIYIEALLVDEEAADQVWEAWDARETDDETARMAWLLIAGFVFPHQFYGLRTSPN